MNPMPVLTLIFPLVLITFVLMLSARPRRGVVFGISVPVDVASGPQVSAALRRYRLAVLLPGVAACALCAAAVLMAKPSVAMALNNFTVFLLFAVALIVRSREAAKLRPLHVNVPVTRSAELAPQHSSTLLMTAACAVLPLIASALWLRNHWQNAPQRWPRHWNAAGRADGWATRSLGHALSPLILGAAMVALFVLILVFQIKAPGPDFSRRRKMGAPLVAMAWAFSLFWSFMAISPVLRLHGATGVVPMVVYAAVMIGITVWICARSGVTSAIGNSGTGDNALPAYDGTSDEFWHAGLFYYNPNDAALLVPKRFGFGWTFNMARPLAWVFLVGVLLFALGTLILPKLLK